MNPKFKYFNVILIHRFTRINQVRVHSFAKGNFDAVMAVDGYYPISGTKPQAA